MSTIKDILKLNLSEDIKEVIDLEDRAEEEIKYEIDNYIVTENISHHLSTFSTLYRSNAKETGVWISGFYGSGKSYFGKMLGYILANNTILGTPIIERFIPRLNGLKNQSLLENELRTLANSESIVVTLDIAKQNTDRGLAFTLFRAFLKNLGFLDNHYGLFEYNLYLDDKYDEFKEKVLTTTGEDWLVIRKNTMKVPKVMKQTLSSWLYTDLEFEDTKKYIQDLIADFDPSKLKEELVRFLDKYKDESIVFIFDEASEAISQNKIDLLELEGVSEALSSISNKVWTIAIAQEKLDDVISNNNISKSQLTKVTDRFKTKIHLEATDVDVIIRTRLLEKKDEAFEELKKYFDKNLGQITEVTNLKSTFPTKVSDANEFAIYYPFHKYQFELLQKFLFSSSALAATQVAARGMIITAFDVIRNKIQNLPFHSFTNLSFLCDEAQKSPDASLVNKYETARKILDDQGSEINGRDLLKVIHFINEAELVSPTAENIAKAYISKIDDYYEVKGKIDEALDVLTDSKVILLSNNNYKITSDLEAKLLEVMRDFHVGLPDKKRDVTAILKKDPLIKSIANIIDNSILYSFNIISDQDEELISSSNKNLKIKLYSLYSITQNRTEFIENIKLTTQGSKDLISIIPDNSDFNTIDLLLEEIRRFIYILEKYASDNDKNVRQILREFSTIKEEKEKDLNELIKKAYSNCTTVYLFNTRLSDEISFTSTLPDLQREVIKNIYSKRLPKQLSENVGKSIIKEKNENKLNKFNDGADFNFFDSNGNFIGDNLRLVEEVAFKIQNSFVDGKSLEDELSIPPTGYSYGTISTVIAVLFRAGRLLAKYNGADLFSYTDSNVEEIFKTSRNFQKASFKAITKSLPTKTKTEIVQILLDLKFSEETDRNIDWNTNDFKVVDSIRVLADHFVKDVDTMAKTVPDFEETFKSSEDLLGVLTNFTGVTTESNLQTKADQFLNEKDKFSEAVKNIVKTEKFIKKNLENAKAYKRFVSELKIELTKADVSNDKIEKEIKDFEEAISNSIVDSYRTIVDKVQIIKDEYYHLMNNANKDMTDTHTLLKKKAEDTLSEIKKYPKDLNSELIEKTNSIIGYSEKRINSKLNLGYSITCKNCNLSLSEMMNSLPLAKTKENELILLQSSIVKEKAPEGVNKPKTKKKISFTLRPKFTVNEYKNELTNQLNSLSTYNDNDEVEINLKSE